MENNTAKQPGEGGLGARATTSAAPVKPGFLKTILGQFMTKEFWIDFLIIMTKRLVGAFFIALGGAFEWYGRNKVASAGADPTQTFAQPAQQQPSPSQAFRGYTPTPSYQPHTYPMNSAPSDPSWPGYGPRG